MLTVTFSEPNQAYLVTFGDSLVQIEDRAIWSDLDDLRWTLRTLGLGLVWKAVGTYKVVPIEKS